MFGFSFGKLLLIAIVVAAVWYAYRKLTGPARTAAPPAQRPSGPMARIEAEDMVKCRACATYVTAARPTRCGRADCPYPP